MSDAPEDKYVKNGSIQWGDVGAAIAGAFLSLGGYVAASYLSLIQSAVTGALDGIGWAVGYMIERPFEVGESEIQATWESAAAAIRGFGPLAWPIAAVVVILFTSLLLYGVNRYV